MRAPRIVAAVGAPRYPVLDAFIADRANHHSFIMGPLGSGKTFACCQRILLHMCEQAPNSQCVRRTRWLVIRSTFPELLSTAWKDFGIVFRGLGKGTKSSTEPPHWDIEFALEDGTKVESEVIFLALDRDDAVRKIRGYQLTGVWANEVKELSKPVLDMAFGRCPRFHNDIDDTADPTWYGIIGDTNAPDEDHWYYRLAEEERPEGWKFFRQPGGVVAEGQGWRVNPEAENLDNLKPTGEIYYRNQIAGNKPDWINVNLANEYGDCFDGKPVHPEFIDSVHVAPEILKPIDAPLILGIDYGRTPAAAIFQHESAMDRWLGIDELVSEDMSAAVFGPVLKRYLDRNYPGYPIIAWGDPAGDQKSQATEDIPNEIMRAAGIPVQPVSSNSELLRRAAFANPCSRLCMDGRPALLISPKMKLVRKGMRGGWQHRRVLVSTAHYEVYADKPDKGPLSHPCFVAGTSIDTPQGPVPIELLRIGDRVCTPSGSQRIVFTGSREAEVIDIQVRGERVAVTPEHPFMSFGGWVRAEAAEYAILGSCPKLIQSALLQYSRGRSIRSTSSRASATTFGAHTTSRRSHREIAIYTEWSGRLRTARFRQAIISIIAMAMGRTTSSRTWSAFRTAITPLSTCASPAASQSPWSPFARPSAWRWIGGSETPKPRERSQSRALRAAREAEPKLVMRSESASTAEMSSRFTSSTQHALASARRAVYLLLVELLAWTMRIAPARSAVRAFAGIATRGRSIAVVRVLGRPRRERVYNVEVANEHCYYAAGCLVSNCEAAEYALMGGGEGAKARAMPIDDYEDVPLTYLTE